MTTTLYSGVMGHLVKNSGVKPEYAAKLCYTHFTLIERGARLNSFPYYVASEILRAEDPPEDWEGFDPDWVEPEDDE